MALDIEPADGYVALKLLEGDDEETESQRSAMVSPTVESSNKAIMAVCVGVGKKVTVCKKGDTVFCRGYAKNGLRVDDDTVLCEAYCVAGKVV